MRIITTGTGILMSPGKDTGSFTRPDSTKARIIVKAAIFSLIFAILRVVPAFSFRSEDNIAVIAQYL